MSSITLNKTVKVNGVLTDATTFTATVVRNDTGASVTPTATHPSTGKYTWVFTEPVVGLTYTVSYSLVLSGYTRAWNETVTGSAEDEIPMPELTGDNLVDTLASLEVERLRASRSGPLVTYRVGSQEFNWGQYLKYLDERIMQVRREIAMSEPFEEMGIVF